MPGSTINDHFVLATYTSSARGKGSKKGPGVFATCHKKSSTTDGYVTVAAQADGIHIIDVSTLHPIISHTLGPSTSFSCPPLTLPSSSSQTSVTYAVIAGSPDLTSNEDAGRTLWMWQDDTSSRKQKEKQSKVILSKGQTAYGLYSCPELSKRVVAASTNGDISVIDAESLEVKSSTPSKHSKIIYASLVASDASSFSTVQNGATLVLCQSSGTSNALYLRTLVIDEADSITEQYEHEIPIDSQKIVSISCSRAGIISVLTLDGTLSPYRLSSQEIVPLSTPLHLAGFSFISSNLKLPVSILSLTSSHVLLAAVVSQEITILLWDVQFSVLLASHTLSIPSSLSASSLHIRLIQGVQSQPKNQTLVLGQAILILSSDTTDNKMTSVLLAVPYSVPTVSTIAAAMGRGAAGKKWLRAPEEKKGSASKAKPSADEVAREKLLSTIQTGMQAGRPHAAVAAFNKWAPVKEELVSSNLDYNFVKELLGAVLQLPSAESKATGVTVTNAAYAPEITQYLLEKRLVSSAMVHAPGGLLGALRARNDWKSIETSFTKVADLTESEIIECLRVVIAKHRAATGEDSMDVDTPAASTPSTTTPLATMLSLVATYPMSRGPLLVAFRRYIPEAAELVSMLHILSGWITQRTNMEKHLMPSKKDLKKTEQGVWTVVGRKHETKNSTVPPLEKIVDLIQVILDASFLALLQHPPAHKLLQSIQTQLSPEIAFADAAETLRGPLEPFAIAQEKAMKESLIPQQEREREKQKGDWRQRRKGVGAAAGVAADIGVYQLEELVL